MRGGVRNPAGDKAAEGQPLVDKRSDPGSLRRQILSTLPSVLVYAERAEVDLVLEEWEDREGPVATRVGGEVHDRYPRGWVGRSQPSPVNDLW